MSQLINIDPQTQQESEPEGYTFGYYTVDTLLALEVSNIDTTQNVSDTNENDSNDKFIELSLDNNTLFELQQKDMFCANILAQNRKRKFNWRTTI